jgi:cytochrome oxidase Cu insertion factor (SCO1/SenC/PrrC family)
MHQLADELRDNVNLLSFSITFDPKWDQQAVLRGWFGNLKEAFSKIDDVTTRNRMLSMSSVAGAVMSRRQDLLSNAQGALPALPAELNQLLFETTMNYLSPSDAKKVYNTVLPFTPPPGNQ